MPLKNKLPIAISMGEPGGINIEIVLKSIKKNYPIFFLSQIQNGLKSL